METSVIVCKGCNQEKTRTYLEKYNHKDKKWVDAAGRAFNGHWCPDCHSARVAARMRKKRVIAPESPQE